MSKASTMTSKKAFNAAKNGMSYTDYNQALKEEKARRKAHKGHVKRTHREIIEVMGKRITTIFSKKVTNPKNRRERRAMNRKPKGVFAGH